MDNNATLANEICRLCMVQPTAVMTVEPPVVYAGGPSASPSWTIVFDNPWMIIAVIAIWILIMIIYACYVTLYTVKDRES